VFYDLINYFYRNLSRQKVHHHHDDEGMQKSRTAAERERQAEELEARVRRLAETEAVERIQRVQIQIKGCLGILNGQAKHHDEQEFKFRDGSQTFWRTKQN
jgi:hypothetical protein